MSPRLMKLKSARRSSPPPESIIAPARSITKASGIISSRDMRAPSRLIRSRSGGPRFSGLGDGVSASGVAALGKLRLHAGDDRLKRGGDVRRLHVGQLA